MTVAEIEKIFIVKELLKTNFSELDVTDDLVDKVLSKCINSNPWDAAIVYTILKLKDEI